MKFRKLLVTSSILATGLTLGSCGVSFEESAYISIGEADVQVNVGMGYDASYSDGQVNVTAAMVAFNASTNVIEAARIDVVQIKVAANDTNDGLVLNLDENKVREDGKAKTKLELGADYGMLASYGSQLAEVDNQIEAYAAWTVGKTAAEVSAAQVYETADQGHKEDGYFTNDATLFASCTITVNSFAAAVNKAYENKSADAYTITSGYTAGVSMNGGVAYNYGEPSTEVSCDLGGVIVENGKVIAAAIDALVVSFTINAEDGSIAVDTTTKYHEGSTAENIAFVSKKDLGTKYGMKSTSEAKGVIEGGAEWYEQAAAIENGVVGKTAAEIGALTEISGATITLSSYTGALKTAAEYAVKEHIGPQHEA